MGRLMRIPAALCAAGLLFVVAGCTTTAQQEQAKYQNEKDIKDVLVSLDRGTELAVNAQRELALTADAKVRRESDYRKRIVTDKISMDFYGDVEQVVGRLANTYNFDFQVMGKKPVDGVVVNVFAKQRPALDVLKQIAYSSPMVDIRVTDSQIILYYKEVQPHRALQGAGTIKSATPVASATSAVAVAAETEGGV